MRPLRSTFLDVAAVLLLFLLAGSIVGVVDGVVAVSRNGYLREGMTEILFWTLSRRLDHHVRIFLPLAAAVAALFALLRAAGVPAVRAVGLGPLPLAVSGLLYLYSRPYWPVYREDPGRLLGKTDVTVFAAAAFLLLLFAAAWYAGPGRRVGRAWSGRIGAFLTRPALAAVLLGLPLSIHLLDRVDWSGGAAPRRNLILVSLDTLRADRLGCYGYAKDISPNIDAFSRESVRFTRAVSQSSWTLPAHAALFTGVYPSVTGAVGQRRSVPRSRNLLAEILRDAGWEASAFTGGGFLNPVYGFRQGFDGYAHLEGLDDGAVLRFIDGREGRPFFLFLHTYKIHNYYVPPDLRAMVPASEFAARFEGWPAIRDFIDRHLYEDLDDEDRRALGHLMDRYDAAIYNMDRQFGGLIDALRERGLYEETVVILLSDHGEEFGDHGRTYHGGTLYNEQIHVPLLIRVPGLEPAGREVDAVVELMDVFPTVLELLGLRVPGGIDARSLVPLIEGREGVAPRLAFSEISSHITEKYAACGDSAKLVYAPAGGSRPLPGDGRLEAFALTPLPAWRERPVEGGGTGMLTGPFRAWVERMERVRAEGVGLGEVEVDTALREELRALGYVQ